jgi:acyl dehydratase
MTCLDDLIPGLRVPYGGYPVHEEALVAFAGEFDPQPMHLDPASEQAALMGGLISSGWQTVAIHHHMLRTALLDAAGLSKVLHVKSLRWSSPVRPGDTLSGMTQVQAVAKTPHPHAALHHTVSNQHGENVMTLEALYGAPEAAPPPVLGGPYPASTRPARPLCFDEVEPGTISLSGEHTFGQDAVARYRALYDPAPPDAPLTVSPWHITAQWLRLIIAGWAAMEAAGEALPRRGPGLGLVDVIWPRTARPGELIRFYSRVESTRPSSSRPGWGIVSNRNYALNAADEVVVAFSSAVLMEGRHR